MTTLLLGKSNYLGASTTFVRAAGAVLGGIIAMIGARMASGCPSGHGLSGMMQLSMSAFVALPLFFLFGVIVANLLFKRS